MPRVRLHPSRSGHCGNMSHKGICGCMPISASSGFNIYSPTLVRGMKKEEIVEMAKAFGRAVNMAPGKRVLMPWRFMPDTGI